MATAAELRLLISARDQARRVLEQTARQLRGLDRALKDTAKAADSMAKSVDSIGNRLSVVSGLVTGALAAIGGSAIKMAMDAVESENLFQVSMGDMADEARRFSEELRNQFGLNAVEVRRNVGVFNNMFRAMGLGTNAAYEMSTSLVRLTYDMASFFNLRPEEAFEKIRAGIMGETEPLRQLGIVINDTAVKQFALNKGLIEAGDELTEQQKVLVRYALLLEQTANAQGDLARTIESPTNQLRIFRARLEEIALEVGQAFLPALSNALLWVNNEGLPAVRRSISRVQEAWGEMSEEAKRRIIAIGFLFLAGGPLLKAIGVAISGVGMLARAFAALPPNVRAAVAKSVASLFILATASERITEFVGDQIAAIGQRIADHGRRLAQKALSDQDELIRSMTERNAAAFQEHGKLIEQIGQRVRDMADESILSRWQRAIESALGGAADVAVAVAVPAFDELLKELQAIGEDGLASVMRLIGTGREGLTGLDAALAKARQATEEARKEIEQLKPPLDLVKGAWDEAGAGAEEAGKKTKKAGDSAQQSAFSVRELTNALIALHPATVMASAAVARWEAEVERVNLAIEANRDQLRAAQDELRRLQDRLGEQQDALRGMQDRLGELNDALAEARRRLQELATPRLRGMREIEEQIAAVETQIKRVRLAELLGQPLEEITRQFPLLNQATEEWLATLPQTEDELRKVLEQLQLTRDLRFDEQLKAIKEAAEGVPEELTFEQALEQIALTKQQISDLTAQIVAQQQAIQGQQAAIRATEEAIRSQQAAIESINAAAEQLNRTLAEYQAQLQQAQRNLQLVTEALQLAFQWFLEDRQAIMEMGQEGQTQAALIDEKTRALLIAIDKFTQDTSQGTQQELANLVEAYKRDVARILAQLAQIPRHITTVHEIVTVHRTEFAGGTTPEGRQHGGPVFPGRAYLVGEAGPELFVPRQSGHIVPMQGQALNELAERIADAVMRRPQTVFNLTAQYRYQDERSLRDEIRLLQLLGAAT